MDADPIRALTGRRRTRPPSIGCRKPRQPKPGRAPLIAGQAAVQTNRATSGCSLFLLLCSHPGRRQAETPLTHLVQKSRATSLLQSNAIVIVSIFAAITL